METRRHDEDSDVKLWEASVLPSSYDGDVRLFRTPRVGGEKSLVGLRGCSILPEQLQRVSHAAG